MKRATAAVWFAIVAVVLGVAAVLSVRSSSFHDSSFKAFYCAGKAISAHSDPYRVEPLRACQHAVTNLPLPPAYVEPAPLPGFALALFAALSYLPFGAAAMVFTVVICIAALLIALLLASLTRAPPAAVLAVLLPLILLNHALGEIPPLATLALCAAAFGVATNRWTLTGVAVALSLVEPHVGLPAVVATAIFVPRSRTSLILTALALAVISVLTIGLAANVEYFRGVLPAQASSELVSSDQYSLSRVLHALGVQDRPALWLGELSYVVMAVIGIVLGRRGALALRAPALMPLVPAAAVLLGGVFMHDIQMLAALPAALVVARALSPSARALGFAMLVAIAIVWTQHISRSIAIVDTVAIAGAGICAFGDIRRALAPTLAGVIVVLGGLFLIARAEPVIRAVDVRSAPFTASANELASTAWARYERATPALMQPRFFQQLPTWVGLILLLFCLAGASGTRRARSALRGKHGEVVFAPPGEEPAMPRVN